MLHLYCNRPHSELSSQRLALLCLLVKGCLFCFPNLWLLQCSCCSLCLFQNVNFHILPAVYRSQLRLRMVLPLLLQCSCCSLCHHAERKLVFLIAMYLFTMCNTAPVANLYLHLPCVHCRQGLQASLQAAVRLHASSGGTPPIASTAA